jgi:hypothetical protein
LSIRKSSGVISAFKKIQMERQIIKGRNNVIWIKDGANYIKGIQYTESKENNSILDSIPDYQIVKEYTVEGWYRFDDEKDFITQTIHATTEARAEDLFRTKYKQHFTSVYIDLI